MVLVAWVAVMLVAILVVRGRVAATRAGRSATDVVDHSINAAFATLNYTAGSSNATTSSASRE